MHCASKFDCRSRTRWHRLKRSLLMPGELRTEIEQRLASGKPQPFYYGLQDSLGHSLAGNLANLGMFEGWREDAGR